MIDAAMLARCSAEPYVATENPLDPRTSASAGEQMGTTKHLPGFSFGHMVLRCLTAQRAVGTSRHGHAQFANGTVAQKS
jgi:hypothetical protein